MAAINLPMSHHQHTWIYYKTLNSKHLDSYYQSNDINQQNNNILNDKFYKILDEEIIEKLKPYINDSKWVPNITDGITTDGITTDTTAGISPYPYGINTDGTGENPQISDKISMPYISIPSIQLIPTQPAPIVQPEPPKKEKPRLTGCRKLDLSD